MKWIQKVRCLRIRMEEIEGKEGKSSSSEEILLRCMNGACYIPAFVWLVAQTLWSVDQTNRAFSYYFLSCSLFKVPKTQ